MSAPQNAPKTAMVLAAGLGTRMRPLTNDRPKALVEVGGRALIDHVLDRLADAGVEKAVVNVHWFADRLESHLAARTRPAVVISDERVELLETGGGRAVDHGVQIRRQRDQGCGIGEIGGQWLNGRRQVGGMAFQAPDFVPGCA